MKALQQALDVEAKKGNLNEVLALKNEIQRLSDPQVLASTVELKNSEALFGQRAFAAEILAAKKGYIATLALAAKVETEKKNLEKAVQIGDEIRAFVGAPIGAAEFQNHYYKTYEGRFAWIAAKKKCEENGGCLACIETKEEEDFIEHTFFKDPGNHEFWIGMLHQDEQRRWFWINGATSAYRKFHTNEPSGPGHFVTIARNSKRWGDAIGWRNSTEGHWYLCEWGY